MARPERHQQFKLPEVVTVLYRFREDRVIAHVLDFDLASSGKTLDEATAAIKATTKLYVEYGLENGLENSIYCEAPTQYWDLAEKAEHLGSSEVILINAKRHSDLPETVSIGITPRDARFLPVAA